MCIDGMQTTLATPVRFFGVALHSGVLSTVTIKPAIASSGIVFARKGENGCDRISATASAVVRTKLGTTISNGGGFEVSTIEHLMAALSICGVSNAFIEIDGPELPILDGSARDFVEGLRGAQIVKLKESATRLVVKTPIEVVDEDRFVRVVPSANSRLQVTIDFEERAIGKNTIDLDLGDLDELIGRVGAARTFCRLEDIEAMREAGLAKGGSLDNAIVVDQGKILNDSGLRHEDEFVCHKALDLIGDLALIGMPLQGHVFAYRCGHDLNVAFANAVIQAMQHGIVEQS